MNYIKNTDISNIIYNNPNIDVIEGEVVNFEVNSSGSIKNIILRDGVKFNCNALIITAGTFLNGLIHIGNQTFPAGRMGEKPASGLTESLQNYNFTVGRLKTGTPPRVLSKSIDWSLATIAYGDNHPDPFSLLADNFFINIILPVNFSSFIYSIYGAFIVR